MTYRQCSLVNGRGRRRVAWIPDRFATVGRLLRLKDGGEWSNGWRVERVFSALPDAIAESGRDEYRYHREVTDV